MAKNYAPPDWSALPTLPYELEVLKGGVSIDKLNLGAMQKEYLIFGRQANLVDVLIEHPSISRQHAIIQFRNDGACMLIDLSSAQGTFLNKTKLCPLVHERVYVGDVIKFGESTRIYLLNGPECQVLAEYDSKNLQEYRNKLAQREIVAKESKLENEQSGASWGFDEDAVNDEMEEEDEDNCDDKESSSLPDYLKKDENYDRKNGAQFSVEINDDEVNEKDKALLEKIRKREKKIQNMQEEISRIYKKEGSQDNGLTAGQSAAVQRNDGIIAKLKEEIDSFVHQLRSKEADRKKSSLSDSKSTEINVATATLYKAKEEEEGGPEDLTADTADASTNWRLRRKQERLSVLDSGSGNAAGGGRGGGQARGTGAVPQAYSHDELCALHDKDSVTHKQLQLSISNCRALIDKYQIYVSDKQKQQLSDDPAATDSEEVEEVVHRSNAQEAEGLLKNYLQKSGAVSRRLTELKKLIEITRPALMRAAPSLATAIAPTTTATVTATVLPVAHRQSAHEENNIIATAAVSTQDQCSEGEARTVVVTTKKSQQDKANMQSLSSFIKYAEDEKKKSDAMAEKEEEEEASLRTVTGKRAAEIVDALSNKKIIGPSYKPFLMTAGDTLQGGDKVWVPPKNQTGNGYTALNAKLGY